MNQENLDNNEEMETDMEPRFEALKPGEVASFSQDFRNEQEIFYLPLTFQSQEVEKQIAHYLIYSFKNYREYKIKLFSEGCQGEVLKFGAKDWEKGKIRIKINVEFCPDEPQEEIEENEAENSEDNNSEDMENEVSPLDDLRQKFNQEKQ
ncbi:MAG: KGK domain-containing protein [Trichodesmium sp.]